MSDLLNLAHPDEKVKRKQIHENTKDREQDRSFIELDRP